MPRMHQARVVGEALLDEAAKNPKVLSLAIQVILARTLPDAVFVECSKGLTNDLISLIQEIQIRRTS